MTPHSATSTAAQPVRFGVNYTPRVGWFHHWLDFSSDEVARDFDTIAELGVDHVRVFPLWPLVQPNRTLIRPAALADLERVLELADQRGLSVAVDGLQGHLSSFDFLPSWLTSWHRRELFREPEVIASTADYLRHLAAACAGHPNLLALTVGNEFSQFTGGVHPEPYAANADDVTAWLQVMLRALREGAGGAGGNRASHVGTHDAGALNPLVLHASYDATWYDDAQPFTPAHAATLGDVTAVHSWVFNGTAQRYGPDSFETGAHARYLAELARAFHVDPDRQIWMQELGAPRNVLPEASIAGFIERTMAELADTPALFGVTWWCSHDVSRSLADFPELEYDLGLIDSDGRVKAAGVAVRDAVAAMRARRAAGGAAAGGAAATTPVTIELGTGASRTSLAPGGEFFERYMDVAKRSGHPRVALNGSD